MKDVWLILVINGLSEESAVTQKLFSQQISIAVTISDLAYLHAKPLDRWHYDTPLSLM